MKKKRIILKRKTASAIVVCTNKNVNVAHRVSGVVIQEAKIDATKWISKCNINLKTHRLASERLFFSRLLFVPIKQTLFGGCVSGVSLTVVSRSRNDFPSQPTRSAPYEIRYLSAFSLHKLCGSINYRAVRLIDRFWYLYIKCCIQAL